MEEKKMNLGQKLAIIGLVIVAIAFSPAYGLYMTQTHEELMQSSDVVVIGTVIDTKIKNERNFYIMSNETHVDAKIYYNMERVTHTILVEEYLKNTIKRTGTLVDAIEPTIGTPGGSSTMGKIFENDDRVLLYFYKDTSEYLPESHIIPIGSEPLNTNQICADAFDKIYYDYVNRPIPACALPDVKVQCEPVGLESFLRNDKEFNELECPLYLKDWAYLTDNNDRAWETLAPHYTFDMDKVNKDSVLNIKVNKWGFDPCSELFVYIISHDEKRELVETLSYANLCSADPYDKKFKNYKLDLTVKELQLPKGNYVIYLFDEQVSQRHFTEDHEDPEKGETYQEELTKFYFSTHYDHPENKLSIQPKKIEEVTDLDHQCDTGLVLIDGDCLVVTTDSPHYVNTSPFYQSLMMFSVFLWPFFISGAAIFIVLAKTPRYKKSTRISVTLFGSLVIVWFLIMMFIGIWPQMGD